jgi:hypothetical protein
VSGSAAVCAEQNLVCFAFAHMTVCWEHIALAIDQDQERRGTERNAE